MFKKTFFTVFLFISFILASCSSSTRPTDTAAPPSPTITAVPITTTPTIPSPTSQPTETGAPDLQPIDSTDRPSVAAGAGHTCILTNTGRVKCWGHNGFGQLGGVNRFITYQDYEPVILGFPVSEWIITDVRGLSGEVKAIVAGAYHTCALTQIGTVKCWGLNASGQLGDGTTTDRNSPVDVNGQQDESAIALAAGDTHTCALMFTGKVVCWGENTSGQLGDGTTSNSSLPVLVQSLPEGIVQLAAGSAYTCALTKDGRVSCWGNGLNGRFGDGVTEHYLTPVELAELNEEMTSIAVGQFHICALTRSNEVWCWGALSSEEAFTPAHPFVVEGINSEVVALAAGGGHTCALTDEGGVKCWGDNYFGQLGNATDLGSFDPVDAMGLTLDVVGIGSGSGHVCALLGEGEVACWGDGSSGQSGHSTIRWKWERYTNAIHGFSIEYPAGWVVLETPTADYPTVDEQVWFYPDEPPAPGTDARAAIVLILTQEDPSPNWQSQFFENYKSEPYPLDNVDAQIISGINKESQLEEMAVITMIGEYYLVALPNLSDDSLKYFDQVIASFQTFMTGATLPLAEAMETPQPSVFKNTNFEGISFTYDSTLAEEVTAQSIPTFIEPGDFDFYNIPNHIRFDFLNPYTYKGPFAQLFPAQYNWAPWLSHQNPDEALLQPQVFFFSAKGFAEISSQAGERIETLKLLLDTGTHPVDGVLPVLPWFNSAQDIHGQMKFLEFQGGRGIRFVAHYSQDASPVVNPAVFYTFQGLTEDGQTYVAAFFPLHVGILPDQIQVDDLGTFGSLYESYLDHLNLMLEALEANDFKPGLDVFDSLVQSIQVTPTNTVYSPANGSIPFALKFNLSNRLKIASRFQIGSISKIEPI